MRLHNVQNILGTFQLQGCLIAKPRNIETSIPLAHEWYCIWDQFHTLWGNFSYDEKKVKIALKRSLFLFDFALKMHTKMPCLSVQNFTLHLRSLRVHPRMLLVLFSEPGIKLFEHQTCLNCARIYWGRCLCRGSCRFRCGFLSHFGQLSVIANEGWNDHRHHCHQREQNKESWKTGSWQADSIDDVLLDFTL